MTSTSTTYTTTTRHTLSRRRGPGAGGIATTSTPNLNRLYSAHSSRPALPTLARKGSVAALTQNSLAAIPDDSEAYALNSVLTTNDDDKMPAPLTPARPATAAGGDEPAVGDIVEVPGNLHGTVRFVGSVPGRKGTFAGVELLPEFASRGKNSGDVDGVSYFTTTQPGAGIFLPLSKAAKRESPSSSFALTPTPSALPSSGLRAGSQNSTNFTPPTPSLPKLNQSLGPARAPSPAGKKPPRGSLPRPESPVRRLGLATPRPSITTPTATARPPTRYGSPNSKLAQSTRGTAGDPSKRLQARDRNPSIGPRSASALANPTHSRYASAGADDDATPLPTPAASRSKTNGSVGSVSSFSMKLRPASRATNHANNDDEADRLRAQLDERDRQLKEQAASLAEMESSLTELQGLIETTNGDPAAAAAALSSGSGRRGSVEDKDVAQLRALLREKNDKIAMLTAEFDAHRADFRSTIDTLEMASTETERVYEKRIEELSQEIHDLQERTADVDNVASQLKQLEELVQELEEGLEDARRGEAEARGEVEFLRGEVERTRTELRREREKAQGGAGNDGSGGGGADRNSGGSLSTSKELEQKEDEIRGLKAIIHSLSRDSIPGGSADASDRMSTVAKRSGSLRSARPETMDDRLAREKLEQEVAELQALVENKTEREDELERELEMLRQGEAVTSSLNSNNRASTMTIGAAKNSRSSLRDSHGTVILAPHSPEGHHKPLGVSLRHSRGVTLDTMPESDAYSTATENSTLWCEICDTAGHDILTCTNMFGPQAADQQHSKGKDHSSSPDVPAAKPAPLSPAKRTAAPAPAPVPAVKILPNPMESGPVAGKESGVVDASKWCALCERDGHDSVDCPFEDAF